MGHSAFFFRGILCVRNSTPGKPHSNFKRATSWHSVALHNVWVRRSSEQHNTEHLGWWKQKICWLWMWYSVTSPAGTTTGFIIVIRRDRKGLDFPGLHPSLVFDPEHHQWKEGPFSPSYHFFTVPFSHRCCGHLWWADVPVPHNLSSSKQAEGSSVF